MDGAYMRHLLMVLVITIMTTGVASAANPSLSDADAVRLLETEWNGEHTKIPIGRIDPNHPDAKDLEAWHQVGLIGAQRNNRGQIVNVVATTEGKKFVRNGSDGSYLIIKKGEFVITKWPRNDAIQDRIGTYRIVLVLYNATCTPEFRKYYKIRYGYDFPENGKARVLLKYDYFSSQWKVVGVDWAAENGDFKTNHVRDALSEAIRNLVP
jgi:hypothetical protein